MHHYNFTRERKLVGGFLKGRSFAPGINPKAANGLDCATEIQTLCNKCGSNGMPTSQMEG